jgi:hypothetical protein
MLLFPQKVLTIKEQEFIDTETGTSQGVDIPRDEKTIFQFLNNSLTAVNSFGYLLQAGDENPGVTNNNLDGEVIAGNLFTWNGIDQTSMTHALFTGYNIDVIVKYNYLNRTPNAIQRKSDGMTDNSGMVAYNILNNPKLGIAVKGINGIRIFNNTFYSERTSAETNRGLVDIHFNTDGGLSAASTGTKVFNNIFYTRNKVINIKIQETECLEGFESDYNLFWCEAGEPVFEIAGQLKSFMQWQALGYDLHSVVINPDFLDFNEFIPRTRLDYGKDLGPEVTEGLAVEARWNRSDPATAVQNGKWQVGARIFKELNVPVIIYPNPAINYFYILAATTDLAHGIIRVYDYNGQLLFSDTITTGLNKVELPAGYASGLYNISFETDSGEQFARKILLIR